jgi:hypothetical protein
MPTESTDSKTPWAKRTHPFGEHGVLMALPLSLALWVLIALPFM